MGDIKIVQGPEVVFETAEAQADGNKPLEQEPQDESPEEVQFAVFGCVKSQELDYNARQTFRKVDLKLLGSVLPYLRFMRGMKMTALPIPKDHLMDIMALEKPEIEQLLDNSDVWEALPETYDLHKPLPDFVRTLGYSQTLQTSEALKKLEELTRSYVALRSGYPLSLFIDDGKTYRHFLRKSGTGNNLKNYLYVDKGLWGLVLDKFQIAPFPTIPQSELESFVRTTGHKNVQRFLTDLAKLDEELDRKVKEESFSGVVKVLYNRLKKYHPELTI